MFALLAERVFTLQIIKGADYQKNFIMLIKKPLSIEASRGNIYDVNGELLAYNQLAYSVVISDNGSYFIYEGAQSSFKQKSLMKLSM